jgi:hypothetical protein
MLPSIFSHTLFTRFAIGMQKKLGNVMRKVPLRLFDDAELAVKIDLTMPTIKRLSYFLSGFLRLLGETVALISMLFLAATTSWMLLLFAFILLSVSLTMGFINAVEGHKPRDLYKKTIKLIKRFSLFHGGAGLISLITVGVALVMVSFDIYHGRAEIGSFILVYSTAKIMQGAFQGLFDHFILIGNDGRFINDYYDIMNFEEYSQESGKVETLVKGGRPIEGSKEVVIPSNIDIEFKNVNFTYPETSLQVLKDVSVTIRQGEKIAIVGENGSGKSTFIALLCGMYKPDIRRRMAEDRHCESYSEKGCAGIDLG